MKWARGRNHPTCRNTWSTRLSPFGTKLLSARGLQQKIFIGMHGLPGTRTTMLLYSYTWLRARGQSTVQDSLLRHPARGPRQKVYREARPGQDKDHQVVILDSGQLGAALIRESRQELCPYRWDSISLIPPPRKSYCERSLPSIKKFDDSEGGQRSRGVGDWMMTPLVNERTTVINCHSRGQAP